MFAGMLRFVCTNSLVAGERFEDVRVPHKGKIQHDIIEGVYTVAEDFPRLIDASETMKEIQLGRSEEHKSELQSLMRTSYAVFCLTKKTKTQRFTYTSIDNEHTTLLS